MQLSFRTLIIWQQVWLHYQKLGDFFQISGHSAPNQKVNKAEQLTYLSTCVSSYHAMIYVKKN
jgi:hypothetical protein